MDSTFRLRFSSFFLLSSVLCLLSSACGPTPEKFIEKSRTALLHENYDTALLYMKNAYELSLPKEFFLTERDYSYAFLRASFDGKKVLLVENKLEKNAFDSVDVFKLDRVAEKKITNSLKGKIRDVNYSPDGAYAVFLQQKKPEDRDCLVWIWDTLANKMSEVGITFCVTKPAVKNDGSVWYLRKDQIHTFDSKTGKDTLFNRGRKPEKSAKKFPAYAFFYAAPDNKVWMIYGAAGSYRLYQLGDKLKLISKEIAVNKLYLLSQSHIPGVFIGGAGAQQFITLDPKSGKVTKRMKAKTWTDAAFINEKSYYYIEDGVLAFRDERGETELPFWAEQLAIGIEKELLFLSSTGTALRYTHKEPPPKSLQIYNKAVEIDDSKT